MSDLGEDADGDLVEELVFQCLEAGGDEAAFDRVTRDRPELRESVRRVLQRLGPELIPEAPSEFETPERLGEYRLLRKLGAGGMGVVHLAQQEGLDRLVALKVVRPDYLFFPESRARFRREVEAVARLQHPGIVPIYSVGEEQGLPYFAMEYLEGCSCEELVSALGGREPRRLRGQDLIEVVRRGADHRTPSDSSSARRSVFQETWSASVVEIAIQVADALQHAHERGVLHRDVKPSNVLLTTDGRARLLDFGLARTEDSQVLTRTSAQLGSLPYMPPERLEGNTRADPPQDIYALGVTLYELLALRNPFLENSPERTQRNVQEQRMSPLRTLNPAVSRDLETVCLVAMDPEPSRRYASAAAFGDDLQRAITLRPIAGRRPSLGGRMVRFGRRKPAVAAALLLAVILCAGVPTVLLLQERSARSRIETQAAIAAETTEFLVRLFEAADPAAPVDRNLPARALLEQGSQQLEASLQDSPAVRARLLGTLGRVYRNLGSYARAAEQLVTAEQLLVEVLPEDAVELRNVRWVMAHVVDNLARHDEAIRLFRQVLAGLEREYGPDHTYTASCRADLGVALQNQGVHAEAEQELRAALAAQRAAHPAGHDELASTAHQLAAFLTTLHRPDEALPLFVEAVAWWDTQPGLIRARAGPLLANQSRCLADLGRFPEAKIAMGRALEIVRRRYAEEHPVVGKLFLQRGHVLGHNGERAEAERCLRTALGTFEASLGTEHPWVGRTLNDLATLIQESGRNREATELLERAVRIYRQAEVDPRAEAIIVGNLAETLANAGRQGEAETAIRRALALLATLDGANTTHLEAGFRNTLGWTLALTRRFDAAEAEAGKALALLAEGSPRGDLAVRAHLVLSFCANNRGNGAGGRREAEAAIALSRSQKVPSVPLLGLAYNNLGWAHQVLGDGEAAEEVYLESIRIFDESFPGGHPDAAYPLNAVGSAWAARRAKDALPLLRRAHALRQEHLAATDYWRWVSTHNLAATLLMAGEAEAAWPVIDEAVTLAEDRVKGPSRDLAASLLFATRVQLEREQFEDAVALGGRCSEQMRACYGVEHTLAVRADGLLGVVHQRRGDLEEAEPLLEEALPVLREKLTATHEETRRVRDSLRAVYLATGREEAAAELGH